MILDASAIVAVMEKETGWERLFERLEAPELRLTYPVSVFEAAVATTRLTEIGIETALRDVREFLVASDTGVVQIGSEETTAALQAHGRYGKGRHPARLNMGGCFSYAVAKLRGMPLLYSGEDFALTDLA